MDLKKVLEIQMQIVPEIVETINVRYDILKTIEINQPIGRRVLAFKLSKSEKIIRTEVEKLRDMGFIDIISSGMIITDFGKDLLANLDILMSDINNLSKSDYKDWLIYISATKYLNRNNHFFVLCFLKSYFIFL